MIRSLCIASDCLLFSCCLVASFSCFCLLVGEVRHLGEFGGLVPPPYRFVVVCLALLVVVCLAPLHSPYWGAATHLKYKKTYLTREAL